MKKNKSPLRKSEKLILIISILIFLGILAWSIIVYVPPVNGRVVDAETQKPLKGVNVKAGWVTGYADPAGGSRRIFKVYATKTDENGEFVLPKTVKLKIPIIERYKGINILIYEHEYKCQYIIRRYWREGGKTKYYQIALETIKDDEKFSKNLQKLRGYLIRYWRSNDIYKSSDLKFIVDDFKIFFKRYPVSRLLEENYLKLAGFYEVQIKDYKAAYQVNKEFIEKFPNSPVLNSVKEDIQRLKKLLKESQKSEGSSEA